MNMTADEVNMHGGLFVISFGATLESGGLIVSLDQTGGIGTEGANPIGKDESGYNQPELFVTGDFNMYGSMSGTAVTISDAKIKDIDTNVDDALDIINHIQGVSFRWKNENSTSITTSITTVKEKDELNLKVVGVIAQEVERTLPEAVTKSKMTGWLAVDYLSFVPVLIEALKRISARYEEFGPVSRATLLRRKRLQRHRELKIKLDALMKEADELDVQE